MKVTVKLDQDDYNAMHDVILEACGFEPTNEQIQEIWDKMPDHVKGTAIKWGCSDTVFRDNMYVWLKELKKKSGK